jgi:dethiobiotin synthetase
MTSPARSNAGWPAESVDVGLVDSAGGVASPVAADGDGASLVCRLPVDAVILVSDPSLGVINLVRLSVRVLEAPVIFHLNRMDPANRLHLHNRDWLVDRERLTVMSPHEGLLDHVLALL